MRRQQLLYLWLAEGTLESSVIGWAFHDGAKGASTLLPDGDPPYATGLVALEEGWLLMQSPLLFPHPPGSEHEVGYLPNEFLFQRIVKLP